MKNEESENIKGKQKLIEYDNGVTVEIENIENIADIEVAVRGANITSVVEGYDIIKPNKKNR